MSAVNEGAMRQAIPCPGGKPVKARATYCSTPCRRRAQNARARSKVRVGVLSPTTPPTALGGTNPLQRPPGHT
jgi:hypothetical protein